MGGRFNKPDVLSVLLASAIDWSAVCNYHSVSCLLFCVDNRQASRTCLALLALSQRAEVVKVSFWHSRHVLAVEDSNFKVIHLAVLVGRTHARGLEALEVQVHQVVSLDILGDFFRCTTMCSKFCN